MLHAGSLFLLCSTQILFHVATLILSVGKFKFSLSLCSSDWWQIPKKKNSHFFSIQFKEHIKIIKWSSCSGEQFNVYGILSELLKVPNRKCENLTYKPNFLVPMFLFKKLIFLIKWFFCNQNYFLQYQLCPYPKNWIFVYSQFPSIRKHLKYIWYSCSPRQTLRQEQAGHVSI